MQDDGAEWTADPIAGCEEGRHTCYRYAEVDGHVDGCFCEGEKLGGDAHVDEVVIMCDDWADMRRACVFRESWGRMQ